MTYLWKILYSRKEETLYVTDFHKAFDTIWHEALLLKLLRLGIGGCFYNIIKCMYVEVTAAVRCGHSLTGKFDIQRFVN